MAKKRKSGKKVRYQNTFSQREMLKFTKPKRLLRITREDFIQDDRRHYRPERQKDYLHTLTLGGRFINTNYHPSRTLQNRSDPRRVVHHFINPRRVMVCIRRKVRREFLFSNLIIGKGKAGPKEKRYTEFSKISCRR